MVSPVPVLLGTPIDQTVLAGVSAGIALVIGMAIAYFTLDSPLHQTTFRVAVIGAAGAGKTTFIRAVTKCSSLPEEVLVPTPYTHSGRPSLVYFDMPSYGTAASPASTYWEKNDLGSFHLLVVLYKEALDQDTLGMIARALREKVCVFACHAQFDNDLRNPLNYTGGDIFAHVRKQAKSSFWKMTEDYMRKERIPVTEQLLPHFLVSAHDKMVQDTGDPNLLPVNTAEKAEARARLFMWDRAREHCQVGDGSTAESSNAQDAWRRSHNTIFDEDKLLSEWKAISLLCLYAARLLTYSLIT